MSLSITEAISEATSVLRSTDVSEARGEAASLLANVLGQDRTFLITHAREVIRAEDLERFRRQVGRRAAGEPLQYITGYQEFFGLDFEVNRNVLIPRPETELLVESALELIGGSEAAPFICDIGTGSGCIAIALLHERPLLRAIAVDISAAAVRVATRNAARHQVSERVSYIVADSFAAFQTKPRFNMIVSNPPYVAEKDLPGLQREVREHEPRVALTSNDGLSMIRSLLNNAPTFLVDGGHLVIEIGYDQRAPVEESIDARIWKLISMRNDLQGIPRTVTLQKRDS